ncbi:hypothetical protein AS181_22075 [Gordonia sp. SGD-V-85]|nr:hypothetical protein AS181_22075 [Gordonia sp. SGD-V-85]
MNASAAFYDKSKLSTDGDAVYPFVSRTRAKNGIDGFCPIQAKPPEPGNAITIGLDTQTVTFQPASFYTSQNIQVLRHPQLNDMNGPILATLIAGQMARFSWGGNGATLGRLRKTLIMVPVVTNDSGDAVVDWDGMTDLGKELRARTRSNAEAVRQTRPDDADDLPKLTFAPMFVVDHPDIGQHGLFRTHKGKRLTRADRRPGTTPFVTGSRMNNSIRDYASVAPMFPGGWVSLIYNGDGGTGHAKYQPVPFSASDDVIALEPLSDDATEYALLVLVTILTHQCVSKFGFGYKLTLERLLRQRIMVPVTTDGSGNQAVDWEGMTAYGRALRVRAERSMGCRGLTTAS